MVEVDEDLLNQLLQSDRNVHKKMTKKQRHYEGSHPS